jgi:hypothetical protein
MTRLQAAGHSAHAVTLTWVGERAHLRRHHFLEVPPPAFTGVFKPGCCEYHQTNLSMERTCWQDF